MYPTMYDPSNLSPSFDDKSVPPSPSPGASSVHLPLLAHEQHSALATPSNLSSSSDYTYSQYARSVSGLQSIPYANRMALEESQVLGRQGGSMLLYRLATPNEVLRPPNAYRFSHFSLGSQVESMISVDSKYPTVHLRGLVPYAFDPDLDEKDDAEDLIMYGPDPKLSLTWSWRGFMNISALTLVVIAIFLLLLFYPIFTYVRDKSLNQAITQNILVNSTGQVPPAVPTIPNFPQLIDQDTPISAYTRMGYDGEPYSLVFSDEFNLDGRTFYPGDDPYWEAVDLWYSATEDLEWYDPGQAFTQDGKLVLLLEQVETNGLQFRSGMVQGWNKFCFTNAYVEVSVSLPGMNSDAQGYWPGVWMMGNLGRPGYEATTDGVWPYTYDTCDIGTLPNQTYANGTGPPPAAINSNTGNALSKLPGQKLSACTCPGEDHPGPNVSLGRGSPEMDILEAEKNKLGPGGKISQSAQFAPFSHDYYYDNSTLEEFWIRDDMVTQANFYRGSVLQQAISTLTDLPNDIYNGSGGNFYTYGLEYHSFPSVRSEGFVTWQANGEISYSVGAGAVGPDLGDGGSQVDQRLISEEPMALVLNLAISNSFQTIDYSTLSFPASFMIDYVRVYQRSNEVQNIGCDPPDYPTREYISRHMDAYSNPLLEMWGEGAAGANYSWPVNSLVRIIV